MAIRVKSYKGLRYSQPLTNLGRSDNESLPHFRCRNGERPKWANAHNLALSLIPFPISQFYLHQMTIAGGIQIASNTSRHHSGLRFLFSNDAPLAMVAANAIVNHAHTLNGGLRGRPARLHNSSTNSKPNSTESAATANAVATTINIGRLRVPPGLMLL